MSDLFIVDSQYSRDLAHSRAGKSDLVYLLVPALFDDLRTNGVILSPLIIYKTLSEPDRRRFDRMLASSMSNVSTTEQRIFEEIKSILVMFMLVRQYIAVRKIRIHNIFTSRVTGRHKRLNSGLSYSAYEMAKHYVCSDIGHTRMVVDTVGMTMQDRLQKLVIQCILKINRIRRGSPWQSTLRRVNKSHLDLVIGSGIPSSIIEDKKVISFIPRREVNLKHALNRTVFSFNMRCCWAETDALKKILKLIMGNPEYLYEQSSANASISNFLSIMASSMLAQLRSEARWITHFDMDQSINLFLTDHNNILFYLFLDLFASRQITLIRHGGRRYDPRTLHLISQGSNINIAHKDVPVSINSQEPIRHMLSQKQIILIVSYAAFKETGFKYLPDTQLKACAWIEHVERIIPDRICIAKKPGSEALTTSLDLGLTCDIQIRPTSSSLALGSSHIGLVVAVGIIGSGHHQAMDLGIPLLYLGDEPNQCAGTYVKVNVLIDDSGLIIIQSNSFDDPHPSSQSAVAGYYFAPLQFHKRGGNSNDTQTG